MKFLIANRSCTKCSANIWTHSRAVHIVIARSRRNHAARELGAARATLVCLSVMASTSAAFRVAVGASRTGAPAVLAASAPLSPCSHGGTSGLPSDDGVGGAPQVAGVFHTPPRGPTWLRGGHHGCREPLPAGLTTSPAGPATCGVPAGVGYPSKVKPQPGTTNLRVGTKGQKTHERPALIWVGPLRALLVGSLARL